MAEQDQTDDTGTEDTDAPEGAEVEADDDDDTDDDGDLDERSRRKINKANREAKNLRDRLKAAEGRLAEVDDATKTETERMAERLAAAEARAAWADRLEVAGDKGLTPAQARRLQGDTHDELAADADAFLAELEAAAPADPSPATPRRRPQELRGGNDPEADNGTGGKSLSELGASMASR